jgi:heme-degrading monooxygenase HmoA
MTVAVIFTSTRTLAHDAEYAEMAELMEATARRQPGFVDIVSVRDPVTRRGITVAYFEDEESVRAWKAHPEHAEAQRRGRADFYEQYHVTVAHVGREYGFPDSRVVGGSDPEGD